MKWKFVNSLFLSGLYDWIALYGWYVLFPFSKTWTKLKGRVWYCSFPVSSMSTVVTKYGPRNPSLNRFPQCGFSTLISLICINSFQRRLLALPPSTGTVNSQKKTFPTISKIMQKIFDVTKSWLFLLWCKIKKKHTTSYQNCEDRRHDIFSFHFLFSEHFEKKSDNFLPNMNVLLYVCYEKCSIALNKCYHT